MKILGRLIRICIFCLIVCVLIVGIRHYSVGYQDSGSIADYFTEFWHSFIGRSVSESAGSSEREIVQERDDEESEQKTDFVVPEGARHIVIGDVFETGDRIWIDKTSIGYQSMLNLFSSDQLTYYVEGNSSDVSYVCDLFGNPNIRAFIWDDRYFISIGNRVIWSSDDTCGNSHWTEFSSVVFCDNFSQQNENVQFYDSLCSVYSIENEQLCSIFYIQKAQEGQ